ncbi:MAG TPA: hypothetical protein PLW44_17565 [Chitinophagales bacterium]|nr:hypothetical protein [Chitinophagales bacterium]
MEKNNGYIAIILCILVLYSCNSPTKKVEKKKFHYSLSEIKRDFPEYKYRYDSLYKEGYLEYYNSDKLIEMFVFDSNDAIKYYVYYNTALNEVRYSLEYSTDGKVVAESGKPVYLTSDFFGNNIGEKDSFGIFINLATPPYLNSSFVIYNIKGSIFDSINEYRVKKSHTALFVGRMDNEKQKKYAVISKIMNPFDSTWKRIDTAYFSVNK